MKKWISFLLITLSVCIVKSENSPIGAMQGVGGAGRTTENQAASPQEVNPAKRKYVVTPTNALSAADSQPLIGLLKDTVPPANVPPVAVSQQASAPLKDPVPPANVVPPVAVSQPVTGLAKDPVPPANVVPPVAVSQQVAAPLKDTATSTNALPVADSQQVSAPLDEGPAWNVKDIKLLGDLKFAEDMKLKETLSSALVQPGKPMTKNQIEVELKKICNSWVDAGYYLSSLYLSKNAFDEASGMLTVRVGAGFVGKTHVKFANDKEDGTWFSKKQIERKFENLKEKEVFCYKDMYAKLAEMNQHPDLTVNTKITVRKPIENDENGERRVVRYADLDFVVKESFPLHGMVEINNYGTESIGEWQGTATLQYLNLTKADDVLTFSPSMALDQSMWSLAGSYMRPHHIWKGGATTLYGGWSELDSENIVPNIDLAGMGWFVGLVHSYTLIDNESRLLSASAGLVYRYIEDQFSAFGVSLQERNVTVLPLTIALSYSDRSYDFLNGRNFATLQGVYNLMAGGDNELNDMWYGAEDNYMIARLQLARIQPLFGSVDKKNREIHQWTLFIKAEGQYASDPLIPAEKLFLGGYNTVRGYTTKGYLGDNGMYGTVEFRTPILLDLLASPLRRQATGTPIDRLQFLVFTDAGYTMSNDPLPGANKDETLLSVGLGARIAITKYSQFRIDYGVPMLENEDEENSSAFYLSAQLQF
jgi:hemolysin activation/secretion protein